MSTLGKFTTVLSCVVLLLTGMMSSVQAQDIQVGVAWSGKSGMANRMTAAMEKYLAEHAPQIKLEWYRDLATIDDLMQTVNKFQTEKAGMVIMRSNGSKALSKVTVTIPTFVGAANDPEVLGTTTSLKTPDKNITGTTYNLSYEVQFKTMLDLLPNTKSVLLLTENGHPSGPIDARHTERVAKELGIKYTHVACKDLTEVQAAIDQHIGSVDVIILGNQSLIFDNTAKIIPMASHKPIYSYAMGAVKDGALAALSSNDSNRGVELAKRIIAVLVDKKAIKDTPFFVDENPVLNVNVKTAEKLGLELPLEVLQAAVIIE